MTPSAMTCGSPPSVTTRITRKKGIGAPPVSMKSVCNGELLASVKVNENPLLPTADTVTSADTRASIKGFGAGTATMGPMRMVRQSGLAIASPRRNASAKRYLNRGAGLRSERIGIHRRIRVANEPVERWVAQILG